MITISHLNLDGLSSKQKHVLSLTAAPGLARPLLHDVVERYANSLLVHCTKLHEAGKTAEIRAFLAKAGQPPRQ